MEDFEDYTSLPVNVGLADLLDDPSSDTISSLQAVANIFTHPSSSDIFAILSELPSFLYTCPEGLFQTILPTFCSSLPQWSHDVQLSACTQLLEISRFPNLPPSLAKLITLSIVQVILPLTDLSISFIPQLLLTSGDILSITLCLPEWTQHHLIRFLVLVDDYLTAPSYEHRLIALKILRALASSQSTSNVLESAILPRLWNIISDSDPLLVTHSLHTLCMLSTHYSHRKFFDRVWPKLIYLSDSTTDHAHRLSKSPIVAAIAQILSQQQSAILFTHSNLLRLASYFQHLCIFAYQNAKESTSCHPDFTYDSLLAISAHMSTYVKHLAQQGAIHWQKHAIRAFSALSTSDDPSIRLKCVINFPTISSAFQGKQASTLTRLAESFATDRNVDIRRAFALNFQQIISNLATQSTANLFTRMFQLLLDDDDKQTTITLLDSLGLCMKSLATFKTGRTIDLRLTEAFKQIAIIHDWRIRESFAKQFGIAASVLTSQQRAEVLILLRELFRDGAAPVRKAAGASYIRILRVIRSADERWQQLSSFFGQFGHARCTIRLSTVDVLFYAAELFSRRSFAMMFAPFLIRMTYDNVSNVRLKIARKLHRVAHACEGVAGYNEAIHKLKNDDDIDVRQAMAALGERVMEYSRNQKQYSRRDAKKLAYERWLYQDRFSQLDPNTEETDRTRSEKSEKSGTWRHRIGRTKRQPISHAFSKVKTLFSRGKRKLKVHVTDGLKTGRGTSGEGRGTYGTDGTNVTRGTWTSGTRTPEVSAKGETGVAMSSERIGTGESSSAVESASNVCSGMEPVSSSLAECVPMNYGAGLDDGESEEWVRLPDRDMMDGFDEMSFSTASFGEMTASQWMSSYDGSVASQSMISHTSQTLDYCADYEGLLKHPQSLPASKLAILAKVCESGKAVEKCSRKSL